jgi:hypothetical protein
MTTQTWTTPRPATAQEKTTSLRHGLIWSLAVVHAFFTAVLIAIYGIAQSRMNGNPWNDLGVTLASHEAVGDLIGLWAICGGGLTLGAVALYFGLKSKWRP